MDDANVISGRYRIEAELGKGGFGQVFKVLDTVKNVHLALKKDICSKGITQQEAEILKDLQGGEGIPKLYDYGKTRNYSYMVMQLLGESLSSILRTVKKFNMNVITAILLQIISRIEYIHGKGYIHRDIKPQQLLIGPRDIIYLVDYGISKKYLINKYHITFQTNCSRAGSSSYASLNSHIGARLSRRDDLESFMYSAIYLLKGSLPWSQFKHLDDNRRWYEAFQIKKDITVKELFKDCPTQFAEIFSYVRTLKFEDKPNYEYIKDIIRKIRDEYSLTQIKLNFHFSHTKHSTVIIQRNNVEESKNRANEEQKIEKELKKKKSLTLMTKEKARNKNFLKVPSVKKKKKVSSSTYATSKTYAQMDETIKDSYPEFLNKRETILMMRNFQEEFKN